MHEKEEHHPSRFTNIPCSPSTIIHSCFHYYPLLGFNHSLFMFSLLSFGCVQPSPFLLSPLSPDCFQPFSLLSGSFPFHFPFFKQISFLCFQGGYSKAGGGGEVNLLPGSEGQEDQRLRRKESSEDRKERRFGDSEGKKVQKFRGSEERRGL